MTATITIRNEQEVDYKNVEEITRKSFWNLYVPGCMEHYLVHVMRTHEDFLPELDFVIEVDGRIIGNIMYTKTRLVDESGEEKNILTFGPVCIVPEYQRKGYGKKLMEHSFERGVELGYDAIVIFGNPNNYVGRGFKSCKKFNVCLGNGTFPAAMMVKELKPGVLDGEVDVPPKPRVRNRRTRSRALRRELGTLGEKTRTESGRVLHSQPFHNTVIFRE